MNLLTLILAALTLAGVLVLLVRQGSIRALVEANHSEVESLHADVLTVTGQRDAARNVSEVAVDTVEAAVHELRVMHEEFDTP